MLIKARIQQSCQHAKQHCKMLQLQRVLQPLGPHAIDGKCTLTCQRKALTLTIKATRQGSTYCSWLQSWLHGRLRLSRKHDKSTYMACGASLRRHVMCLSLSIPSTLLLLPTEDPAGSRVGALGAATGRDEPLCECAGTVAFDRTPTALEAAPGRDEPLWD